MAGVVAGVADLTPELLSLVHDISGMCGGRAAASGGGSSGTATAGDGAMFKKDCTDLVRRISLLTHLFEEIRDLKVVDASGELNASTSSTGSASSWASDMVLALQSARRLLSVAMKFRSDSFSVSLLI